MSKNVAVFVDVANIFYAAKAAGVDIDYVTLLKSATAGRDFVRAYAYTGLDPDNENQRQFHGFLARSGYRVVSKDIRKYGDGKVKANLDIELVVDLMKTSRNLDVAVIVSGDGDFAPAIRAVQEMGVRCEVISFRGNTSSDLMDAADVFTDITQIARVEKGTGRSGRRVAAEGDLSMTEVPDKETEGAPRRRGGRRRTGERDTHTREPRERDIEREPAAAAVSGARPNLVVLPGEKLSRVAAAPEDEIDELPEPTEVAADAVEVVAPVAGGDTNGAEPETEESGRRRRRRGGRGRGRGRGEQAAPAAAGAAGEPVLPDEDEDVDYEPPRMPQHTTFGSVWDSQLGVPSAPAAAAGATPGVPTGDEDFDDEPEIPEYLLAERRQARGRGNRGPNQRGGGRGGRAGAYQAAVQRERYGRGAPGGGFAAPRRDDRPFGRPNQGGPQSQPHRPAPFSAPPPAATSGNVGNGGGADPWSEVPPEIEAMLRAELARKGGAAAGPAAPASARSEAGDEATEDREVVGTTDVAGDTDVAGEVTDAPAAGTLSAEPEAPKRRTRRTRTSATTEDAPAAAAVETPTAEAAADEAAPKRRTRRTKATADAESTATAPAEASADAPATPEAEPAPKPRTRRTASATSPAAREEPATDEPSGDAPPARKRQTRRTKATEGEASGSEA